jgi:hypothetical protein
MVKVDRKLKNRGKNPENYSTITEFLIAKNMVHRV